MHENVPITIFRFSRSCDIDVCSVYLFSAVCIIWAGKVLAQEVMCCEDIYRLHIIIFLWSNACHSPNWQKPSVILIEDTNYITYDNWKINILVFELEVLFKVKIMSLQVSFWWFISDNNFFSKVYSMLFW